MALLGPADNLIAIPALSRHGHAPPLIYISPVPRRSFRCSLFRSRCRDNPDYGAEKRPVHGRELPLSFTAFSYSGLIEQPEYEGFTTEEATFAADNCGADWNEQAAKTAQSYVDLLALSRDELLSQLEYEGFTTEQALYGVAAVGY